MNELIQTIKQFFTTNVLDACVKIAVALVILVIGLWLVKALMKRFKKGKLISKVNPAARSFLYNALDIVLKGVVVISACAYVGVPMASVVAVLGSAGVAIGLALQGGLSNIAGGVMLIITKPFEIDDYVSVAGQDGTVKDVGIYYTTLVTVDNKKVVIPNGSVTSSPIVNYTSNGTRRLDFDFSVDYSSDIDTVKKILLDIANANELVMKDPAPVVYLTEHADSAIRFALRVWVKGEDYWTVKFDTMEKVKHEFDKAGISIPFPQLDVHVNNK